MITYKEPEFEIIRKSNCVNCRKCVSECANLVHEWDETHKVMISHDENCVDCQRCVVTCPVHALKIVPAENTYRPNTTWKQSDLKNIYNQAGSGKTIINAMGNQKEYPIYWDHILINASQVTNPSIDPLREPMETKVYLGRKPEFANRDENGKLMYNLEPNLEIDVPVLFAGMSLGAISLNAHKAIAKAAKELGTFYNTGEGGWHPDLKEYKNTIVQIASGRFGVDIDYLDDAAAIEIKIGQGAKPGIGGHLPGAKINDEISKTRMIPEGVDALSPAPHHDIYSIEDLRQLVYSLKEATNYTKPIIVKVAAVHNIGAIASGIARSGADIIAIDGFRGGTGAAPKQIRDNVGIPIELALAVVDERLRVEGIRDKISLIVSGSIRNSGDVVKAIALGADAVYIGTAALVGLGCHLCQSCNQGRCNWGIATQNPDLVKRLNVDEGAQNLVNLVNAWNAEIKEMLGGMGINAIESLRGNRLMLRGVGLTEKELEILGIKHAGE